MRRLLIALAATGLLAAAASADEIIFKQDYGDGKSVKCQIYKEDADYIHYIDVQKDQDAGCARSIVEKIVYSDEKLVDVKAFFERKAAEAKDQAAAEAARTKAEEVRKAEEARAAAEKQAAEAAKGKSGKLKMRSMSDGVKVTGSGAQGAVELVVDPFPEEDQTPPPPPKKGSGPAK